TRGEDLWTYLRGLPLDRTVEIHVSDPVADRELLMSLLDVAPVRAVTLGWVLREHSGDPSLIDAVQYLRTRIGMGRQSASRHATAPVLQADTPVCLARGVASTLRDGRLRVTGGARKVDLEMPVDVLPLLAHFSAPQPLSSGFTLPAFDEPAATGLAFAAAKALLDAGALAPPATEGNIDGARESGAWAEWDAAFNFYLATRNSAETSFARIEEKERELTAKAEKERQPSAYKEYWAHPFFPLANPLEYGPADRTFQDVLLSRRTLRSFASDALDARDLSNLLFYVWGATCVQRNDFGDVFLRKTSPSGGSLHGTEVYPILMNV